MSAAETNDRISLFAGPSGGHLFPAMAFGESLRARFPGSRMDLVTSRRALPFVSKMPEGIFDRVVYLPEFPFSSRMFLLPLWILLQLPRAFALSFFYLLKARPKLCVGFGSYVSYPGVLLSSLKKIPTVIHEQNLLPGIASRKLARQVDCVAVSFEKTFAEVFLKRRVVTGLPIRSSLSKAAARHSEKKIPSEKDLFRILILGGSQGSHALNEKMLEALRILGPEEKKKIAVMHITGQADFDEVNETYREMGLGFEAYAFFDKMEELYGRADMAITRAGANTLFELVLFKLPAVVVPYPHAGAHQAANARAFADQGAVLVREECQLEPLWLAEQIRNLMTNADARKNLASRMARFARGDAAERLADIAEGYLRQGRDRNKNH